MKFEGKTLFDKTFFLHSLKDTLAQKFLGVAGLRQILCMSELTFSFSYIVMPSILTDDRAGISTESITYLKQYNKEANKTRYVKINEPFRKSSSYILVEAFRRGSSNILRKLSLILTY